MYIFMIIILIIHAPIINVHALFQLNVSAFEALHDVFIVCTGNIKMHKLSVFDLRGLNISDSYDFSIWGNLSGFWMYKHCIHCVFLVSVISTHNIVIPVETLQHLFVSSILNESFISNPDRQHAKHNYIHNCLFHAKIRNKIYIPAQITIISYYHTK